MAVVDLPIYQGRSLVIDEPVVNPDGTDFVFTGGSIQFTVKDPKHMADADDANALIRLQWKDGGLNNVGIDVNLNTAVATIRVPASSTVAMVPGKTYFYDITVTDSAGNKTTTSSGKLPVLANVTKSEPT